MAVNNNSSLTVARAGILPLTLGSSLRTYFTMRLYLIFMQALKQCIGDAVFIKSL